MPAYFDEPRNLLTCWEYDRLTRSNTTLHPARFNSLVDALDSINHDLKDRGITEYYPFEISGYERDIRFTQYVGVVHTEDLTIQVLPKVSKNYDSGGALTGLLQMLSYSENLGMDTRALSGITEQPDTIIESLIFFFAYGLEKALSQGINRTYVTQEYDSRYLKGQLLMEKEILKTDRSRFWIRTSDYIEDNELNRFLKAATRTFIRLAQNWEIRRSLSRILAHLANVSDVRLEAIEHQRMTFTRLNASYEPPYRLAGIILGRSGVSLSERKFRLYHFLINMYDLFEAFIAKFLEENQWSLGLSNHRIAVQSQGIGPYYLGSWEPGRKGSQLIPDIAILDPNDPVPALILDTKYKDVDESEKPEPETGDLYQLFAYLQKTNCKRGLLVYPSYQETKLFERTFKFDDDHSLFFAKVKLDFTNEDWKGELTREISDEILGHLLRTTPDSG